MDASGEEDDDVDMEEPEDDDDDDDEDFGVKTSKKKKTASVVPKRSSKKASPNRSKGDFPHVIRASVIVRSQRLYLLQPNRLLVNGNPRATRSKRPRMKILGKRFIENETPVPARPSAPRVYRPSSPTAPIRKPSNSVGPANRSTITKRRWTMGSGKAKTVRTKCGPRRMSISREPKRTRSREYSGGRGMRAGWMIRSICHLRTS